MEDRCQKADRFDQAGAVVMLQPILDSLNAHKRDLLLMAEAMLLPQQFTAYRKLLLNRLGRQGFEGDLERIIAEHEQHRNGHGQADTCKKGGAP
jgi:hypothetical protein